ncbi:MAG: amphi-Trp domain-containing protein [Deltaproteobacteria bacterium]|jgi:amphi-Trp domain-containing protein|nr:amphi-Trp domain-containing protein [Deltaproteobacteria bacterium]
MTSSNFSHSFVSDPEDVARYLEALIEGFRKGSIAFKSPKRNVILEPAEILDVSIEAGGRKGRQRLSLNVSWPEKSARKGDKTERGLGLADK